MYIIFQYGLSARSLQHVASGEPYLVVKAPKAGVLRERKPGGSRITSCDLSLEGMLSLLLVKAIPEASPVGGEGEVDSTSCKWQGSGRP